MNIAIIGGTGLVGPHLVQEIFCELPDANVYTINRSGIPTYGESAIGCDRNNKNGMAAALSDIQPDYIIDMIPFTQEHAETLIQCISTIGLDASVIAISSIDVYAAYGKINNSERVDYQRCPIQENDDLRHALGPEGADYDKLSVERVYKQHLKNLTTLRLPAIYGWPDTSRINNYLDPMLAGHSEITIPKLRSNWRFSRCYHKNAAFAVVKAVQSDQRGINLYNVAEVNAYTDYEWCQLLAQHCGWRGKITFSDAEEPVNLNQDFVVCTEKIRRELGYFEKYSPAQALSETVHRIAYERRHRPYEQCY